MRFFPVFVPRIVAAFGLAALAALPTLVPSRDVSGWGAPAPCRDAPGRDGPRWWDVRIRLDTRGRYALIGDEKGVSGEYAYEVLWSGSMEGDDPDFILYHTNLDTVRWEMKERPGKDGSGESLSEKDFPVRPVFRMNYVLVEGGRLHFFFCVEGFPVPRNESPEKFDLVLPCSRKESAASASAGYDDAVTEGSNDVSLDEKEIRKGSVKRVFRWSWKRYRPSSAPPPAGPLLGTHEAKVTLTVTPHR